MTLRLTCSKTALAKCCCQKAENFGLNRKAIFSHSCFVTEPVTSVADPHHLDADSDPDPACHFNADPDPDPVLSL